MDILGLTNYLNIVFFACIILSSLCALQGVFIYVSKSSLAVDSAAHACVPGAIIGSIITSNSPNIASSLIPFIISIICSFLALWLISFLSTKGLDKGTATASVTGGFLGLGISLLSCVPQTEFNIKISAISIMFGQPTGITLEDAKLILATAILITSITAMMYKEFKLFLFDKEQAILSEINIKWVKNILLFCQIVTIALSIKMVGALMAVALIAIPTTCAKINSQNLSQMILFSLIFAISATLLGLYWSLYHSISSGGAIIVSNCLWLLPCYLYKSVKGGAHG